VVLNVPQTVVAAMGAACSKTELTQRQINVIANDQQLRQRQLIEINRLPDRPSTEVHERFGLQQEDLFAPLEPLGQFRVEPVLETANARPLGKGIDDGETHIVPGARVLFAGIAQAHNHFHGKSEIRISKPATNPKFKKRNTETKQIS
jgi:hypothetical protein